jgi:predicted nucleotidyltransferase component of viral defense system
MEIKSPEQLEKAKLEDTLVELLFGKYNELVFHGGTAIWRCYAGNRFSRDIDFYLKASGKEREVHYKEMAEFLKDCGFPIKEKGYNNETDTMHFLVESNTKMKIDINFRYKNGSPAEYTKIDNSKIIILSLTPEELLAEKIDAYNDKLRSVNRPSQPEVQDLYDIYYLSTLIKQKDADIAKRLRQLVKDVEKNPPPNVRSLGHLILNGLPPSLEFMVEKLKEWANDNQ